MLASIKTKQIVLVTNVIKGITIKYPYAIIRAEAFIANNFILMNKLKSKNIKLYKGKYLIK